MKSIWGIALLFFVSIVGWRIGGGLTSDALSMAVGILLGIMAGMPATLILLASARRAEALRSQAPRPQEPPKALEPPTMEQHIHFHYHGAPLPAQPHGTASQARQVTRRKALHVNRGGERGWF